MIVELKEKLCEDKTIEFVWYAELHVEMMWIELSFQKNNSILFDLIYNEFLWFEFWFDVNYFLMRVRIQTRTRSNLYNNLIFDHTLNASYYCLIML
jgi:hypothetical protein